MACAAILLVRERPLQLFRYQDNLVVRILFWPLVLGAWLGLTVLTFA